MKRNTNKTVATVQIKNSMDIISYDGNVTVDQVKKMISNRIYSLRREHNMTQEEMAEAVNVTRSTIHSWENNMSNKKKKDKTDKTLDSSEKDSIKFANLISICNAFHVNPSYLWGEIQDASIEQGVTMNTYGLYAQSLQLLSNSFDNAKKCSINLLQTDEAQKAYMPLSYINYFIQHFLSSEDISDLLLEYLRLTQLVTEYEKESLEDKENIKKLYDFFIDNRDIQFENIALMADSTGLSLNKLIPILWKNNMNSYDEQLQKLFDKYHGLVIKYFDVLSGVTEMKKLKIENSLRWEQTQIMLDYCRTIQTQSNEYYSFSDERAKSSGMEKQTRIIKT